MIGSDRRAARTVPVVVALTILLALTFGCTRAAPGPGVVPTASDTGPDASDIAESPTPVPGSPVPLESLVMPLIPLPSAAPGAVDAAVAAAGAASAGRDVTVGVAVLDRTSGEVAVNDAGTTPMRAASLAKLITAIDVVTGRAVGRVPDDPADDRRIQLALGPSDDPSMNVLWSTRGGPAGVGRVAEALGLTATSAPEDPSQWGETMISARDAALLVGAVTDRLDPADRALVLDGLAGAPATAADGFDQGFGLLEPSGRGTARAKQGWLCCIGSRVDLHSVGLPQADDRYVMALLSNQPLGYDAARDVLDAAARAARAELVSAQ